MSTAPYSEFCNEGDDKMYAPPSTPPGYAPQEAPPCAPAGYEPQGAPPVAYAPPMGQSFAPLPPVDTMMTEPQTQTIISTTHIMPNDHFGLALFVCLCCFWPLGIVALIKSGEVRSRFNTGDMLGANQSSEDARKFSMIGLGIGIASAVVSMIVVIIYVIIILA